MILITNINKPPYKYPKHVIGQEIKFKKKNLV